MGTGAKALEAPRFTSPLAGVPVVSEAVRTGTSLCRLDVSWQPVNKRDRAEFSSNRLEKSKTRGKGTEKPTAK